MKGRLGKHMTRKMMDAIVKPVAGVGLELRIARRPLASVGLGWVSPALLAAAVGAFVGAFVPRKHRSLRKTAK